MIAIIRSKIQNIEYRGVNSIDELHKILGASKFILQDISRGHVGETGFVNTMNEIDEIDKKERSGDKSKIFSDMKCEALEAVTRLMKFLSENNIEESTSLNTLLRGEKIVEQEEHIKFALLLVEQNNLDYFKDRPSHLPSQPHDRLSSHYMIYSSGGVSTFFFPENCTLPTNIQDESSEAVRLTVQGLQK